jgi:hypothetical protein
MTGEAGGAGTWYLAIMWQNQHFLRGLRVSNFIPVPNPERLQNTVFSTKLLLLEARLKVKNGIWLQKF